MPGGAFAGLSGFPADPSQFGFLDDSYSFNAPSLMPQFSASSVGAPPPTIGAGGGGAMAAMGGPMGAAGAVISGIQTLGNLWMGFKAMKLAKKQYKFQKKMTETNLANQMKSYNTALADRARSRGVMEGQSADQVAQYINSNSLMKGDRKVDSQTLVNGITGAALNNYGSYTGTPAYAGAGATYTPPSASASASASASPSSRLSGFSSLASRIAQERGNARDDDKSAG
jgi:hypothetical protein